MPAPFTTIDEARRAHTGQWFAPETMEVWGSQIESELIVHADDAMFFVSSERAPSGDQERRLYTIRKVGPTGGISTWGAFQHYDSVDEALNVLAGREVALTTGILFWAAATSRSGVHHFPSLVERDAWMTITPGGFPLDAAQVDPAVREQARAELAEKVRALDIVEYTVSVSNAFEATSPEDAVRQFVTWIVDHAHVAGYWVGTAAADVFVDADDIDFNAVTDG